MSNPNFVHVGRVSVRPAGRGGPFDDPAVEVVVGVRADLGHVVVNTNGHKGGGVPPLTPEQAAALALLVDRAAGVARELAAAYRTYQETVRAAEEKLAAAVNREVGA
ncbi:hypothetical protein CL60_gp42 [Mycobacterium phage BarrelRoll]|uniref:Uncharacterized protein n=1 Tax=Mycobacterium phage BarrelRoll TaxID=1084722 RepID=G3MCK9_9CAUD|nr:hypothetical protein CL60_gp42 [Mycobacterium phage BarrelRoll]AEO94198.1 hypothetical protein BARRELROLL_59 [Mycobacterium phage BarrelRoll]ASR87572.1 hypothetical protein SEA_SLIMPHAZIE_59 [Mycobacterium phage Slimphazie]QFG14612.1 hypothetical protein SEA_RAPUNZEL97_60 [Mycobacterium phage Rapunzel97]WNM73550.1 hypothetical protein SEA_TRUFFULATREE_59 [Mycobacterium Phage TruffulaTree]